jgi:prefoldin subunit 5
VLSEGDRKAHNDKLAQRIRKLRKKLEHLQIERNAKKRILDNPRHGEEVIRHYHALIRELDEKVQRLEEEVAYVKSKFL